MDQTTKNINPENILESAFYTARITVGQLSCFWDVPQSMIVGHLTRQHVQVLLGTVKFSGRFVLSHNWPMFVLSGDKKQQKKSLPYPIQEITLVPLASNTGKLIEHGPFCKLYASLYVESQRQSEFNRFVGGCSHFDYSEWIDEMSSIADYLRHEIAHIPGLPERFVNEPIAKYEFWRDVPEAEIYKVRHRLASLLGGIFEYVSTVRQCNPTPNLNMVISDPLFVLKTIDLKSIDVVPKRPESRHQWVLEKTDSGMTLEEATNEWNELSEKERKSIDQKNWRAVKTNSIVKYRSRKRAKK